jgi:ankyrin repeat protein
MDINKKNFKKLNTEAYDLLGPNDLEDNSLVLVDNDSNLITESNDEEIAFKNTKDSRDSNISITPSIKETIASINDESENSLNNNNTQTQTEIDWKKEALIGNFMPATVKLHRKEIDVNEVIDPSNENRLIHLSVDISYLNVTRCFLEIFEADINSKNSFGQTPLHMICNSQSKDAFLFSYLIKNDHIQIDAVDKSGFTPMFFSVMNNFNVATLALANLKADLAHLDNFGNNLTYHAIINGNKFALNFLMRHLDSADLNTKFYKGDASLADVLITSRLNGMTRHLVKYHHNEINLSSIESCRKALSQFPHYNKSNYDVLNTLYNYKTNNIFGMLKALFKKESSNTSDTHGYTLKFYNLKLFLYDLMLNNTKSYVKYSAIFFYLFTMLYFTFSLNILIFRNSPEIQSITDYFTFFNYLIFELYAAYIIASYILSKFMFYKYEEKFYDETQYNLTNPLYLTDHVAHQIYQAMERNPLDLFFEEEICEVCLTKKAKSTNHCHICKKCVPNFYFHSKLLGVCFSRSNVFWYILLLPCLAFIHTGLIYFIYLSVDYETLKNFPDSEFISENSNRVKTIYSSNYFTSNLISFVFNSTCTKLFGAFILFVTAVLYLQTVFSLILCIGYNVTYYNMFRYHKKSLGEIRLRNNLYYNIPHVNLLSFPNFVRNLIGKKTD